MRISDKKVSICIPAYQEGKFLRRLLESIEDQTFRDYEVIITDDSADESVRNVVKEFEKDDRITYIKNRGRLGSPRNWNECINHSSGEYVKLMHHDDWFAEKNALGEFVDMLESAPNSSFGFCSTISVDSQRKTRSINTFRKEQLDRLRRNPECLFNKVSIGSPSVTIYRRNVGLNFDDNLKYLVDFDFYMRVLNKTKKFVFNPKPLVCVTVNSTKQVTSKCMDNKRLIFFEYFHVFKKMEKNNLWDYKYFNFFICNLLYPHRVKSENDLKGLGIDSVSTMIKRAIFVNRVLMKIMNILKSGRRFFS